MPDADRADKLARSPICSPADVPEVEFDKTSSFMTLPVASRRRSEQPSKSDILGRCFGVVEDELHDAMVGLASGASQACFTGQI